MEVHDKNTEHFEKTGTVDEMVADLRANGIKVNDNRPAVRTITNTDAEGILAALIDISNSEQRLPVKVGFRIMQNIKTLTEHVQVFQAERDRIIQLNAKDGKTVRKEDDPEVFAKVMSQINELAGIEISVTVAELDREEVETLEIPMKQMFALMFITKGGWAD